MDGNLSMKVLVITSEFPPHSWGGVGRYVEQILCHAPQDVCIDVVNIPSYRIYGGSEVRSDYQDKFDVLHLFDSRYSKSLRKLCIENISEVNFSSRELARRILDSKIQNYDVIYLQDAFHYFIGKELAKLSDAKLTAALHLPLSSRFSYFDKETSEDVQQILEAALIRDAEKIMVPSEFSKRNLEAIYNFNPSKVQVCPLGVKCVNGDREEYFGPIRIISIMRMSEQKGLHHYPIILRELNRRGKNFSLKIIGRGPHLEIFRSMIEEMVGNNKLTIISHVEEFEELVKHYQDADVFLGLSAQETFGMALLEAMACGCVPIAYEVGAISELLGPGSGGIGVPPYDWHGAVDHICELDSNRSKLNELSSACMEWAGRYQWEEHVKILRNHIWR